MNNDNITCAVHNELLPIFFRISLEVKGDFSYLEVPAVFWEEFKKIINSFKPNSFSGGIEKDREPINCFNGYSMSTDDDSVSLYFYDNLVYAFAKENFPIVQKMFADWKPKKRTPFEKALEKECARVPIPKAEMERLKRMFSAGVDYSVKTFAEEN